MKKLITPLLTLLIIISVAFNIYQFIGNRNTSTTLNNLQTEHDNLSASISEKDKEISDLNAKQLELKDGLSSMETEIATIQTSISSMEEENKEILESLKPTPVPTPTPKSKSSGNMWEDIAWQLIEDGLVDMPTPNPTPDYSNAAPIELPEGPEYVPDGRICY